MKTSLKAILASTLIVSSLGLVAPVSAKPSGDGPDCERARHMEATHKRGEKGFNVERLAKKLELSEEQRTQIEGNMAASKQQMKDQHDKLRANRKQLRSLTMQNTLDEAALRKLADVQGDLKADMIVLRAQQRAKINGILTGEQRAKLAERDGKKRKHH